MSEPVVLDLQTLEQHTRLTAPVVQFMAECAAVLLSSRHPAASEVPASLGLSGANKEAHLRWGPVTEQMVNTHGDLQEATEYAAYGISALAVRKALGLVVFRRLPKHTGADYLMRNDSSDDDRYTRLECSGIFQGEKETTSGRLKEKLEQLAKYEGYPGYAMVVNLRANPVEIHGQEQKS
jgi:hypothetical protein